MEKKKRELVLPSGLPLDFFDNKVVSDENLEFVAHNIRHGSLNRVFFSAFAFVDL